MTYFNIELVKLICLAFSVYFSDDYQGIISRDGDYGGDGAWKSVWGCYREKEQNVEEGSPL